MRRLVVKLAIFVAICGVFTGYLAFTIGNIHPFRHTYRLAATFDDVTGLLPDDNVKIAGVVVGKVRSISIDQGRARVSFEIETDVHVPSDSEAAIRWRNLLGQRYVYLYPGSAPTVLRHGDQVTRTRSVVDVGELFNRLGPIVQAIDPKQVNTFLDAITAALNGNQDKLRQALDDLATVAATLGERDQAIGRLVTNLNAVTGAITDRDAQIRTVLDNLLAVARTFSANTQTLDTAVTDLGDFTDNLGTLLANNRTELDRIITNLTALTDEVGLKLPTVDHAVAGLDEAVRRIFAASRYGEWLNIVIPCGAIGSPPVVTLNSPCVTGIGATGAASAPAGGTTSPTASAATSATSNPAGPATGLSGFLNGLIAGASAGTSASTGPGASPAPGRGSAS